MFEMLSALQADFMCYFILSTERLIMARCEYPFLFKYSAYHLILSDQTINIKTL